jgi:hypothetical protein
MSESLGRRGQSKIDFTPQGQQKRQRSVGKALEVFWPIERAWYKGSVQQVHGNRSLVKYEDGDEEWLELDREVIKWTEAEAKPKRQKQAAPANRDYEYGVCINSRCSSTVLSCFVCCRNLPVSVHGTKALAGMKDGAEDTVEEWHHVTDVEHFCSHCFELLKAKRVYRKFGSLQNMDLAAVCFCLCSHKILCLLLLFCVL